MNKPKRALVVGLGAYYGAYDAGVLATLCRKLGPGYFDTIYASSVGVFAGTFYAANQPDTIEHTWRHLVDGKKIVNFADLLRGREATNIAKLIQLFERPQSRLDTQAAFGRGTKIIYTLTDYATGAPVYREASADNWQTLMRASSALPVLNSPVTLDGRRYIDGGLADPLPVQKALADGHDEIVAVLNKETGSTIRRFHSLSLLTAVLIPKSLRRLVMTYAARAREIDQHISDTPQIAVIRPTRHLPLWHLLDTDKKRINAAFDQGVQDAHTSQFTFFGVK